MKSVYAPLPFSYLSSDAANPKVGLRKDGVYGTSADVPRVYQPETQDEAGNISMSTEYPYSVYANANVSSSGAEADYRANHYHQPTPPRAVVEEGIYSQDGLRKFQVPTVIKPQKPEGGFQVYPPSKQENPYENPYGGRIPPKEAEWKGELSTDQKYRDIAVTKHPNGGYQPNAVARVPSQFPEAGRTEKQVNESLNNVETPFTYIGEPKQKQPSAVMAKDFSDNFILVKDPNRPETNANPQPISAINERGKNNNLQTLFEAEEPKRLLPRYNVQPPKNPTDSRPSNETADSNHSHNQEAIYDRSKYAPYLERKQAGSDSTAAATISEAAIYSNDRRGDTVHPDSFRNSDARLVKDSEAERQKARGGCACGRCTAVIIAVIVTAIICLGVGFIAGWFGAKAAYNDAGSSPSQTVLTNLSTVTDGSHASTKASAILTTKASAILTTKASAILTTEASAILTTKTSISSNTTKGATNSTGRQGQ